MKILVNGVLVPAQAEGGATLPGGVDGVFETLCVIRGAPELWDEHWARFSAGCAFFGFEPPVPSAALLALARSLVAENGVARGVLRYAAWRDDGRIAWRVEATHPRPTMDKASLRLTLGPVLPPGGPDRSFKHLRRTAWAEALQEARSQGFDEAVLRDAGDRVVETCTGNVFFELAGVLRTPGITSGILPGVYRQKVIAAAQAAGVPIREGDCFVEELSEAREILLTNSLIGLLPAHEYDGRALATGGAMLQRLRHALSKP